MSVVQCGLNDGSVRGVHGGVHGARGEVHVGVRGVHGGVRGEVHVGVRGADNLFQDDGERRRHIERSRVSDHGETFFICYLYFNLYFHLRHFKLLFVVEF